jgi:hypothetical protein
MINILAAGALGCLASSMLKKKEKPVQFNYIVVGKITNCKSIRKQLSYLRKQETDLGILAKRARRAHDCCNARRYELEQAKLRGEIKILEASL